jgi:hypothetical protein
LRQSSAGGLPRRAQPLISGVKQSVASAATDCATDYLSAPGRFDKVSTYLIVFK